MTDISDLMESEFVPYDLIKTDLESDDDNDYVAAQSLAHNISSQASATLLEISAIVNDIQEPTSDSKAASQQLATALSSEIAKNFVPRGDYLLNTSITQIVGQSQTMAAS